MRAWLERRDARERRVLALGGLLVLVMLWWAGLYLPAREARDRWHQRAVAADAAHAWMQVAAAQAGGSLPATVTAMDDRRSLLARVDEGARAAGLGPSLLRVEPQGNGRVRVQFQAVPFDALVDWLQPLRASGVRVEELSLQRGSGVGLVDARLTLAEAGEGR